MKQPPRCSTCGLNVSRRCICRDRGTDLTKSVKPMTTEAEPTVFDRLQDSIAVVPVYLFLSSKNPLTAVPVVPGLSLAPFDGYMAKAINKVDEQLKRHGTALPIRPSHMIVARHQAYLKSLYGRLDADRIQYERQERLWLDASGLTRQVLLALTIAGRIGWTTGQTYTFQREPGAPGRYRCGSVTPPPSVRVSDAVMFALGRRSQHGVTSRQIRRCARALDRYYRSYHSWIDQLGVALGYLWVILTTASSILTFSGLCMALEALTRPSDTEITHQLAERCAILTRHMTPPLERYKAVKQLYALRSKIVHGSSGPKKGPLRANDLFVMPKRANVSQDQMAGLLSIALDTIQGALTSPGYLRCIHHKASDEATTRAVNDYFLAQLLEQ